MTLGGRGATFDLYPNEDVANALDHFWVKGQVVGTICHGAIALGNIPDHGGRSVRLRAPLFHGEWLVADAVPRNRSAAAQIPC
jgi:putative intracellular protease/amidase